MRAVTIAAPGGPEKLVLATLDSPQPLPGHVVIDVASAGVNRADVMQRAGLYPPPPSAPSWPGLEVAGTITAIGPGVDTDSDGGRGAVVHPEAHSWAVGDQVVALLDGGGYAEQVAVPAGQVLPAPRGVDLVDAGGLMEAACTMWSNLVDAAHLAKGDRVLIHGGSGGLGTFAIQCARALGAVVATTAGGPERVARCLELGAEVGIDWRTQDFTRVVQDNWGGVDVILDVVGAKYLDRNLHALAPGGRLVAVGLLKGRKAELDLARLMALRATVTGALLRSRTTTDKARIVRGVWRDIWPLIEQGRIRPVTHARLALQEAPQAHEMLESGQVFGKVLLCP